MGARLTARPAEELMRRGSNPSRVIQQVGLLSSVPFVLLVGPAGGYYLGGALDRRWHTAPWALLLCTVVGGIGSCIEVCRILQWIAHRDRNSPGRV